MMPRPIYTYKVYRCFTLLLLCCILSVAMIAAGSAGERNELRVRAGLDLFPSFLAADRDITNKHGADGKLLLLLVYRDQKETAEKLARSLEAIGTIRSIPVRVELASITTVDGLSGINPAGIFIIQPLDKELQLIIRYAKQQQILLFSPFEGDVARGVPGGISVSDRILPFVNLTSVRASNIQLKSFFLKVAKQYE